MLRFILLVFWVSESRSNECGKISEFPSGFRFGVGSSAYQVEGAWNKSGKGESKWDRLTHRYPEKISNCDNADDASSTYYLWKEDIERMVKMGVEFYRFSISWPRILPNGFKNKINEDGIHYYDLFIDSLLDKGIVPVVTLYHGDMPQILQDLGGWANPKIVEWFTEYARIIFSTYGDRVTTWITINDPLTECDTYYGEILTPQMDYFVGPYMCSKNILLAHAKVWHLYNNEFRMEQGGKVSIAIQLIWLIPFSVHAKELTENARQFITGRFTHPIYSEKGGWSSVLTRIVANNTKHLGFKGERLPDFTQQEIDLVQGTSDFFAMNHYTTRMVRHIAPLEVIKKSIYTYVPDLDVALVEGQNWTYGYSKLKADYPQGLRMQMNWLKNEYGDMEFFITENGYASKGSNLNDEKRVTFIKDSLEQVLLAIDDGINVTGYTYWSFLDSFQWTNGYQERFGLFEVNFSDPSKSRIKRMSSAFYSNTIKTKSLFIPGPCDPKAV